MTPAAGIEGTEKLRSDIHQMCQHTVEMLKMIWEGFKTHNVALLQQAAELGQHVHQQEKTLTHHLRGAAVGQARGYTWGGPGSPPPARPPGTPTTRPANAPAGDDASWVGDAASALA